MSNEIEVVFLGVNDAGMRVYEWLCDRSEVFVRALLTTEEQLTVIEEVKPDLVVSCGYRHIVPESILDVPEMGCLNLHPAYLPYNRGANPNVWSIVEGTPAGVTLHYMDSTLDTGDIVARREVETNFSDTGKDLYQRLEDTQVELFKQTWPDVVGGNVSLTEQEQDEGTYHRTDEFEELCEIDGEETVQAKKFLDRLRALTFPPYDNAKIEVDGETYYIDVEIRRE
ncbi:methionyl-tRNA formyltransferase [Halorubrum xinjiangense]|uniref:Methionyl-tRNA formyltransferase n=1 Tax=Halorubrum xinjiangense TaxID=261291 RepID=A0A1G7HVS2_9EURY|nr:formyltransferase family protein [Halorubrum xinjiangense]SDF04356.1 methionyl-tRNA formyltransferase [Halorubrum xinjiangense]